MGIQNYMATKRSKWLQAQIVRLTEAGHLERLAETVDLFNDMVLNNCEAAGLPYDEMTVLRSLPSIKKMVKNQIPPQLIKPAAELMELYFMAKGSTDLAEYTANRILAMWDMVEDWDSTLEQVELAMKQQAIQESLKANQEWAHQKTLAEQPSATPNDVSHLPEVY